MASQKTYSTVGKIDFFGAIKREDSYYELQGVGLVRIRGLSMEEAQSLYQKYENNRPQLVANTIRLGLTEPQLDDDDIRNLLDAKAGPIATLFEEIMSRSAEVTEKSPEAFEELQGEAGGTS